MFNPQGFEVIGAIVFFKGLQTKTWQNRNGKVKFTVWRFERLVDEIRCRLEVNVQVEVRGVVRGDSAVHDAAAVEVLVPHAAPFGVRGVQDVSDSQLLQGGLVVSHGPAGETRVRERSLGEGHARLLLTRFRCRFWARLRPLHGGAACTSPAASAGPSPSDILSSFSHSALTWPCQPEPCAPGQADETQQVSGASLTHTTQILSCQSWIS